MRLPIRARLTLATAVLMAAVLGVAGSFLYWRLDADLMDAVDAGLLPRADALVETIDRSGEPLTSGGALVEPDDSYVQLVRPDGRVAATSPEIGTRSLVAPSALAALDRPRFFDIGVETVEETVPARVLAVPHESGSILLVGVAIDDQLEAIARLGRLLWFGGPLVLLLATAVGWLLAGAALRPVERMRAEAAALSIDRPLRRLSVPDTHDEISRLGETLNAMLQRLDEAIDRERRFVDEASHELRTPLGVLRAELELALSRARKKEELVAALRSATEEAERLTRLAEDLLLLSRADHGRLPVRPVPVDVEDLVADAVRPFTARADGPGVSIERRVPPGLRANLDPVHMRQAIANLVDNALRFTPPGGTVTVEAIIENGTLSLSVSDTGEGFPPGFLDKAFEPFSRADVARSRSDGGAGLGLAIVRAVAEAHGGSATAANRPGGGGSLVLRLPARG